MYILYFNTNCITSGDYDNRIINEIDPNVVRRVIRLAPHPWLLDIKNEDAQAPIHLAALTRQADILRLLLISGAKASIRDGDGNTALHLACINGDLNTVAALLTPITAAELKESTQMASQLQKSASSKHFSIDFEQWNFYGECCVHMAAQRNQIEILRMLIRAGADINAREGRAGYTPLHYAAENNNIEMANFLLEHRKIVNPETLNYRQVTAYQLACELDHIEMLKILKNYGCRVISPPESEYDSDESDDFD